MNAEAEHYDALVIGTGQAGKPLALDLAKAGLKTAVIERGDVGGTCINVGCTPTKTMVASARIAYLARRARDYGVNSGPVSVDQAAVRKRKHNLVESFRSGSQYRLENTENLELILGEARFDEAKTIAVKLHNGQDARLQADKIFINTGCRPAIPNIDGLEKVPYLDSTSIMELDEVPQHLLVLGGGYIGLEFGQMFRRFGSDVTIVQRNHHLLPREDDDITEEVDKILREDGIDVLLGTQTVQVSAIGGQRIELHVKKGMAERGIVGTHLLVATGRQPNTETLNLHVAGIETDDRGYIPVHEKLETAVPGVYALGDVKGGPQFTHISYDDYRVVRDNLLRGGDMTMNGRLVPYTVFIDPQLGRVGLNEREAKERDLNYRIAKMPMAWVAQALERDESRGFMKAIIDVDTDQILGCAVLGIEGGELMSMIQIAMMGNLPYTTLRDGIFSHPSLSESLNNLFM